MPENIIGVGVKEELAQAPKAIGKEQIQKAYKILQEYKDGKTNLEKKIIQNEEFWKLRHWEQMREDAMGYTPATGWLWNVIVSKQADMEDGFPEPNILPRESGDKQEAEILTSIVPVILDQTDFHKVYTQCSWDKLKQGCSVYKCFWDNTANNGLGDVKVTRVDPLVIYWQPGVEDIQDSRNIFHVELVDNEILENAYPQLKDKLASGDNAIKANYLYDDRIDTSEKSVVIDWYYKKVFNNETVVHYVKFCGDEVLYATENETVPPTNPVLDPRTGQQAVNPETGNAISEPIGPSLAETGLYKSYPYVFDSLFNQEGTPFGYGFTDICKDTQISIDQLNAAITKNALMAASPRYFIADSCDVNEKDFADWKKELVHVSSQMTDETIRQISVNPLGGIYVEILNNQIEMLKETSGNRDVNNGGTTSGVTAASAMAIMAEAGNKQSRSIISGTYEAYKEIVYMIIELIRQFYDTPRQFRIIGERAAMEFVTYDNSGIAPQSQGIDFGNDMGYRVPQFDIEVGAQKNTAYNKMSQNELAIQFYNLQFFNPQNVDQALACLEMMDFDGKHDVAERIERNGTMLQVLQQVFQLAVGMAQAFDNSVLPGLMQMGAQAGIVGPAMAANMPMQSAAHSNDNKAVDHSMVETDPLGNPQREDHPFVKRAVQGVQDAAQPNS